MTDPMDFVDSDSRQYDNTGLEFGESGVTALTATSLVSGVPVPGLSAIAQIHALLATSLLTSGPVLASPGIGQKHELVSASIVSGSPEISAPSAATVNILVATNLLTGLPALSSISLSQIHELATSGLAATNPILQSPSVDPEIEELAANSLIAGTPQTGTPVLRAKHVLYASSLLSGRPYVSRPTLPPPPWVPTTETYWPTELFPPKAAQLRPTSLNAIRKLQTDRIESRKFGEDGPDQVNATWDFTASEYVIFKSFYEYTCKGGQLWFEANWLISLGYSSLHLARFLRYIDIDAKAGSRIVQTTLLIQHQDNLSLWT